MNVSNRLVALCFYSFTARTIVVEDVLSVKEDSLLKLQVVSGRIFWTKIKISFKDQLKNALHEDCLNLIVRLLRKC